MSDAGDRGGLIERPDIVSGAVIDFAGALVDEGPGPGDIRTLREQNNQAPSGALQADPNL